MRIGGLASGMDTEQIVRELMRAERMKGDKLIQNRTTLEWQRDAYRDINLKITSLRDSFRATGLGLNSTYFQKTVTSSNSSVVRATASSSAPNTSVQMHVQQLATSSTFVSSTNEQISRPFNNGDLTLKEAISQMGSSINFDNVTGQASFQVSVNEPGQSSPKLITFTLHKDDKLSNVLSKLNNAGGGFNTYVDQNAVANDPQIVLNMQATGEGSSIRFQSTAETSNETSLNNGLELFSLLGFTTDEEKRLEIGANGRNGTNSIFTLNGHTTQRTTNQFTINGVNYSLTGVSSGSEVTMITTQINTDKIFEDVMKFVEEYNELVDMINGSLREERFRDFRPLTDEQKEAMTEKEIELWEEKARSGLLRNDTTLSNTLSQMRMMMFSGISDDNPNRILKDLSAFGLVTSSNYMDGGKIILDPNSRTMPNGQRMNGEDRMRYYIENHGQEVYQLFMGDSNAPREQQGVLRKLRTTLDNSINNITARAGREGRTNQQFTMGRQLMNLETQITNFERRMQQTEDRYWRQFTAMERAMAQLNSQADQIWSMLMPQN